MKPTWCNDGEGITPCLTCRHEKKKSKESPCKECLASEIHPDTGEPNTAIGWEEK